MNNKQLTLTPDSICISGEHYTVSNGFLSKANGNKKLPYEGILTVEIVKQRSKRAMYAVFIVGCILIAILGIVRASYTSQLRNALNPNNIYNTVVTVYETVQDGRDSEVYQSVRNIITVLMAITAVVMVMSIAYLFTGKRFVEITTMQGIYRVVIKRGDTEMYKTVQLLKDWERQRK